MSTTTKEDQLRLILRSRNDPCWFLTHILGDEPWTAQAEIARSVLRNRRTAIKSCNGAGKTWIASRVVLWFLVCYGHATVVTTAPSTQQVEKLLWKEIGLAWRKLQQRRPGLIGGRLFQIPKLEIEPGWLAYGFSTDDSNNFQGVHGPHILFVLDEAGGIKPLIWEPLEGNLVSEHTRLLAIGNPTDVANPFFLECADPRTNVVTISAYDTPNFTTFGITEQDIEADTWAEKITGPLPNDELITPEWVSDSYRKYGPQSAFYFSRVLGEFPQQGTDSLLWMAWIDRAIQAIAESTDLSAPDLISMGVDVAGGEGGGDESVISSFLWGPAGPPVQLELWGSAETDTMTLATRVLADAERLHARYGCRIEARIDAVGIGKGVVDRLRQLKPERGLDWFDIMPMMSGEAARDPEQFLNKRAEWWWAARERFESSRIVLLEDEQQRTQLTGIRYKRTASDVIQIERKVDAKRRGIPSPDRADAMSYALAPVRRAGRTVAPVVMTGQNRWS